MGHLRLLLIKIVINDFSNCTLYDIVGKRIPSKSTTKMVNLNGRIQEIVSFIDSKVKTTVHRQPTLKNSIYAIECWSEYIDHAIEWLVLGLRESKFCLKCYK